MNSVNTPPSADPNTAPTGAPAEKVANARDRARDGGNACARMPTYIKLNKTSRLFQRWDMERNNAQKRVS